MKVKRFVARTSREAMAKIRAELGSDAVVLKTRNVDGGVEVMAMADELGGAAEPAPARSRTPAGSRAPFQQRVAAGQRGTIEVAGEEPADDRRRQPDDHPTTAAPRASGKTTATSRRPSAPSLPEKPMSTLTFQQFVRERLARRQSEEQAQQDEREQLDDHDDRGHDHDDRGHHEHDRGRSTARAAQPTPPAWPLPEQASAEDDDHDHDQAAQAAHTRFIQSRGTPAAASRAAPVAVSKTATASTTTRARPASPASSSPSSLMAALGAARGTGGSGLARSASLQPSPDTSVQSLVQMLSPAAATVGSSTPAAPFTPASKSTPSTQSALPTPSAEPGNLMSELREMRGLISSQLSSLAWFDGVRRNPVQVALLRRLITCGFSPMLARKLVARLPDGYPDADADQWACQSLARLIRLIPPGQTLLDTGGIYALVGPTGVGKTTTTAKIAAQFALRHGVGSVGLLTVDAYRIGAQDQLRTFGRLLGVPVHVVHDAAGLAEFMNIFMNKKLVLIDTVGVGQRDERLGELLASLSAASIRRLLVLNAAAQAETLEDVISAYRVESTAGVVVSKLDEAVKTGGVADCLIRHRLPLVGMADGQRVPEDWHFPDPANLIKRAMTDRASPVFDLDDNELSILLDGMPAGDPALNGRVGGARV